MTERERERRAQHKLAVINHVDKGSVVATCRRYGISRTWCYKWLCRYDATTIEGLNAHSSVLHHQSTATNAEVVEKAL